MASKPFLMQTLTGSLVTGVGAANVPPPQYFQSPFGIVSPSVMTPWTVSFRWTLSTSPELSSTLAGK